MHVGTPDSAPRPPQPKRRCWVACWLPARVSRTWRRSRLWRRVRMRWSSSAHAACACGVRMRRSSSSSRREPHAARAGPFGHNKKGRMPGVAAYSTISVIVFSHGQHHRHRLGLLHVFDFQNWLAYGFPAPRRAACHLALEQSLTPHCLLTASLEHAPIGL